MLWGSSSSSGPTSASFSRALAFLSVSFILCNLLAASRAAGWLDREGNLYYAYSVEEEHARSGGE
jgi:hypothetical protein